MIEAPQIYEYPTKILPEKQKTRVWFRLSLGKKNRRFSCPRRLRSAFTAAAEASNTSEGPDEKVEASFRHSPVAPQKKGVLIDRMIIRRMVAILDTWDRPLYLSRIWTVYEQFVASTLQIQARKGGLGAHLAPFVKLKGD